MPVATSLTCVNVCLRVNISFITLECRTCIPLCLQPTVPSSHCALIPLCPLPGLCNAHGLPRGRPTLHLAHGVLFAANLVALCRTVTETMRHIRSPAAGIPGIVVDFPLLFAQVAAESFDAQCSCRTLMRWMHFGSSYQ